MDDTKKDLVIRVADDIVATATSVLTLEKQDAVEISGRIIQATIRRRCFIQIKLEYIKLRDNGRIAVDYSTTNQCEDCLGQVVAGLDDKENVRDTADALRKIFLTAATETKSNRDDLLPTELLRIARSLTPGEIIVLQDSFYNRIAIDPHYGAAGWLQNVASTTKLQHEALVETHENLLIAKGLFSPRLYGDRSGINVTQFGRLTSLGHAMCEFLTIDTSI